MEDRADPPRGAEQVLAGLNPRQRAAATSSGAPLCVLAGAGSGKTRVLTRRIAWRIATGSAHPAHVLALTFTRKAAGEMRQRLRRLGVLDNVAAGTFHALALTQLRTLWSDTGRPAPPILDRKAPLLARVLRGRAGASGADLAAVAAEIEWAKARLTGPPGYEAAAAAARRRSPVDAMASVYAAYEEEKARRGALDLDDLLLECLAAFDGSSGFAAAQRWRYRHLFVDEYQDVNPAQARLLEAWQGGRSDLCVVGDPNQAIYSWNGADPSQLTGFARRHPGSTVVDLDDNYRSTPQVLAVARAALAGRSTVHRAHRADGAVPTLRSYASDDDEAAGVARALRDAGPPTWSSCAVLARTNAQLVVIEKSLRAAGVPCHVASGAALLHQPVVRSALRSMRSASIAAAVADLHELLAEPSNPTGVIGRADDAGDRIHLETLLTFARDYALLEPEGTVAGLDAWLRAAVGPEPAERSTDAVELTTFHRSKGLEWSIVAVVGLERGLVPISRATAPTEEAEERRLLYVAMTRARDQLHCSWATRRRFGERVVSRQPSPYLSAIELVCRALARGDDPASAIRHVSTARGRLERGAGQQKLRRTRHPAADTAEAANADLLDELKQWRATTARASGVPAYVIFHDATLAALATDRPRTHPELLAIPGLGPVKAGRYGEELLRLLASLRGA